MCLLNGIRGCCAPSQLTHAAAAVASLYFKPPKKEGTLPDKHVTNGLLNHCCAMIPKILVTVWNWIRDTPTTHAAGGDPQSPVWAFAFPFPRWRVIVNKAVARIMPHSVAFFGRGEMFFFVYFRLCPITQRRPGWHNLWLACAGDPGTGLVSMCVRE